MSKDFIRLFNDGNWDKKYPFSVTIPSSNFVEDDWLIDNIKGLWMRDVIYDVCEDGFETSDCLEDVFYFESLEDATYFSLRWV
jgi:hypothetical protein